MSVAIIGWTGFVGQILTSDISNADLYNSSNIDTLINKSYDIVYCCGMPAEKWRINQSPNIDFNNTMKLIDIIKTIKVNKFILISTVDVLDCCIAQNELGTSFATHPYGIHRKILEDFVADYFHSHHILRLPGLFGRGLKKNILYDLIFDNNVSNICLDSEFQWYNINNIIHDINFCIENNVSLIQLVSAPISVREIVTRFFPEKLSLLNGQNIAKYNLTTLHHRIDNNILLKDMEEFIKYELAIKQLPIQLAISNIAWKHSDFNDVLKIMNSYRIKYIELAPTKIADWIDWSDNSIIEKLKSYNIKYISCQSILYKTDINVFLDKDKFIEHYKLVASICNKLGIKSIVFGSPKARHLYNCNEDDAIHLFRKIGEISKEMNIIFCIEPNSKKYGCTWLTCLDNVINFVKKVDHSSVLVNYDLGNYIMENDNYIWNNNNISFIGHVQISNVELKPLCEDNLIIYKNAIANIINLGYKNGISLEINETSIYNLMNSLKYFYSICLSI
jgi:sugar phosphate isomerase/epimerase